MESANLNNFNKVQGKYNVDIIKEEQNEEVYSLKNIIHYGKVISIPEMKRTITKNYYLYLKN